MELFPIIYVVLLVSVVVILARIERRLTEIARIQRESTQVEVIRRLRDEDLESQQFKRFLGEDFSRSEMTSTDQQAEFQKWKLANG